MHNKFNLALFCGSPLLIQISSPLVHPSISPCTGPLACIFRLSCCRTFSVATPRAHVLDIAVLVFILHHVTIYSPLHLLRSRLFSRFLFSVFFSLTYLLSCGMSLCGQQTAKSLGEKTRRLPSVLFLFRRCDPSFKLSSHACFILECIMSPFEHVLIDKYFFSLA